MSDGSPLPTTVEIDFALPIQSDTLYTIGHPTLGVLNGTAVLAGEHPTDVSGDVYSVEVERGRSRSLDEIDPGRCTIGFFNDDRKYDPLFGPASIVGAGGRLTCPVPAALVANTAFDVRWAGALTGFPTDGSAPVTFMSQTDTAAAPPRFFFGTSGPSIVAYVGTFLGLGLYAPFPSALPTGTPFCVRFTFTGTVATIWFKATTAKTARADCRSNSGWSTVVTATVPGGTHTTGGTITALASPSGTSPVIGQCFYGSFANSIGGSPIVTVDAADVPVSPPTSWLSVTGETWTVVGAVTANVGSPFYGLLTPGRKVRVKSGGITIFEGVTEDWATSYDVDGNARTVLTAVDGLATLARKATGAFTATAGQLTGARVNSVLDRASVNYPASRSISAGKSVLQGDTLDATTNALEYLQRVARTEAGQLFCDRTGVLKFTGRASLYSGTVRASFTDSAASPLPKFADVAVLSAAQSVYNEVNVTRSGGVTQTYTNEASVAIYGRRTLSIGGLLFSTDAQAKDMAAWFANIYATAEPRLSSIRVKNGTQTEAQQSTVVALDIGDLVTVSWQPNRIGAQLVRTAVIEGISHSITPDTHEVRLSLGDIEGRAVYTIGHPVLGVLGAYPLTF